MNRDLRAASLTFPKGKKNGTLTSHYLIHPWLLPGKSTQYTQHLAIIAFTNPVTSFLCSVGVHFDPLAIASRIRLS
jgi:hypothetical protein